MGIEPTRPAWEAGVLPLNYACKARIKTGLSIQTKYILAAFHLTVKGFRDFCIRSRDFVIHLQHLAAFLPYSMNMASPKLKKR